jgi:hypothetical protein
MEYKPYYLSGFETGLVQNRKNFILVQDAFPELENAYIFREGIYRKSGCKLIGRLSRAFTSLSLGNSQASPWTFNLFTSITTQAIETNKQIVPKSVVITIQSGTPIVFTDEGDGTLTSPTAGNSGVINYATGAVTLTHTAGAGVATVANVSYYPMLPVMGICRRELFGINQEQTIVFDQVYAYVSSGGLFVEWLPGTTTIWSGGNSDLFTSTNYWVKGYDNTANSQLKIFWVTNSYVNDPIRYTDGTTWASFSPPVNASGDLLIQCQVLIPFRGRMLALNTFEGTTIPTGKYYSQRVRWSQIGNPFYNNAISTAFNIDAWKDDIKGKGGFLDIPTDQNIIGAGFVRDNLVIFCERSTWQLRYTGNSIIPFQIERVNSELGATSKLSMVQFDTTLAGIGDKALIECDSFSAKRIDEKIPDLVQNIDNQNNSRKRITGIRNINKRAAYWTYTDNTATDNTSTFPNKRLWYNYENASFGIFDDTITYLGFFQPTSDLQWATADFTWDQADFDWTVAQALNFEPIGGNHQGFVFYLDAVTQNDPTLAIRGIEAFGNANPVEIHCPGHNLPNNTFIKISGIKGDFSVLNGNIYRITLGKNGNTSTQDYFRIGAYNPNWFTQETKEFVPVLLSSSFTYSGTGLIAVRDNFSIKTKQFHNLEKGRNTQLGYLDILIEYSMGGEFSLNFYQDSNTNPSNTLPYNESVITPGAPTPFFNQAVAIDPPANDKGSQGFLRVYCPVQSAFLTIQLTFNNEQMGTSKSETPISVSAMVLWMRPAGTQLNIT